MTNTNIRIPILGMTELLLKIGLSLETKEMIGIGGKELTNIRAKGITGILTMILLRIGRIMALKREITMFHHTNQLITRGNTGTDLEVERTKEAQVDIKTSIDHLGREGIQKTGDHQDHLIDPATIVVQKTENTMLKAQVKEEITKRATRTRVVNLLSLNGRIKMQAVLE